MRRIQSFVLNFSVDVYMFAFEFRFFIIIIVTISSAHWHTGTDQCWKPRWSRFMSDGELLNKVIKNVHFALISFECFMRSFRSLEMVHIHSAFGFSVSLSFAVAIRRNQWVIKVTMEPMLGRSSLQICAHKQKTQQLGEFCGTKSRHFAFFSPGISGVYALQSTLTWTKQLQYFFVWERNEPNRHLIDIFDRRQQFVCVCKCVLIQ